MIESKNFKTKKELEEYCIKCWNLPIKENNIDLNFFIGKKVQCNLKNKNLEGLVEAVSKKTHNGKQYNVFYVDDKIIPISYIKVYLINPINQKEELINVKILFNKKYFLTEKEFKSIYYKTAEYKNKLNSSFLEKYGISPVEHMRKKGQNTMQEKYGVPYFLCRGQHYDEKIVPIMMEKYGVVVPIKNEKIKAKISKSIRNKYGVEWFLSRGEHYKKITDTLIDRYGIENPFCLTKKSNGSISDIEIDIINEIITYFKLKHEECETFNNKQKIIYYYEIDKRKWYTIDFYNNKFNIVIEIQGDYWHCNPSHFKKDFLHPIINKTAEEIWENDLRKKNEIINQLNCEYISIWASDWINNKVKILNQLTLWFQK